MGIQTGGEGTK